jgi:RimJ/RimL family protein N-acetyltransferase
MQNGFSTRSGGIIDCPTPTMHTIRRLNVGEAAVYRSLRLEALQDSPEAFSTTWESALGRDDNSWVVQADSSALGSDRATFVVFDDRPIGLAALYRDSGVSPVGELLQMWIAPSHRGGAVAADLLDHLFRWAANHSFTSIRAEVTQGNLRALRFYEKYGFRPLSSEAGASQLTKPVDPALQGTQHGAVVCHR